MKQYRVRYIIDQTIKKYINEAYIDASGNLTDFKPDEDTSYNGIDVESFPPSVKKTLTDEYGDFQFSNFDWNRKQDEFRGRGDEFQKWFRKNSNEQLYKNIDNIIKNITQDMILLKRKKIANHKLTAFEELIIPALGNDILMNQLSEYEADVLLNPYATPESLKKGFEEAKNIIDKSGNIDSRKITKSNLFQGEDIVNIANFREFVGKNPQYKGIYNDWEKLFNDTTKIDNLELHAFRSSTPIEKMRELRNFLIDLKKKIKK
jgi:hypothetical protein